MCSQDGRARDAPPNGCVRRMEEPRTSQNLPQSSVLSLTYTKLRNKSFQDGESSCKSLRTYYDLTLHNAKVKHCKIVRFLAQACMCFEAKRKMMVSASSTSVNYRHNWTRKKQEHLSEMKVAYSIECQGSLRDEGGVFC